MNITMTHMNKGYTLKDRLYPQPNTLKDVTPAESVQASLGSFPRAAFSSPPPDGSGGAFPSNNKLVLPITNNIVKEINNYPENVQVAALKEMLSRLEKGHLND
jgi:hypothetical protein|tara:strand:- start:3218 stop:3526 length:309 start_codon:yes stop_codon:yes gene_type:complete